MKTHNLDNSLFLIIIKKSSFTKKYKLQNQFYCSQNHVLIR